MARVLIVIICSGLAFLAGGWFDSDFYVIISFFFLFYFLADFVYSMGRSFPVLDLTILFSIIQLLVMPILVYYLFNDDPYVKALKYDMTISKEDYYSYMLPAVIALILGIKLPLGAGKQNFGNREYFQSIIFNIRARLAGKEKTGLLLMGIGFSFGVFEKILPSSLYYFLFLFSKLTFVGIFYIYFSDSRNKKLYLILGLIIALFQALITGIFGDLVYLSVLSLLLLLAGRQLNFGRNIVLTIIGLFFVLLLQTIKKEYRNITWGNESVDKTSVFLNIATDRALNFTDNFTVEGMFPTVVRFNQGMIVAKVMDYVPRNLEYQDGKTIWQSIAASFIPRFVWPDKPVAGGHENILLFTGFDIQGYSMNIGPYGEAWGNFGKTGGIVYMFFYALFFNYVLYRLFKHSEKDPTILLWVPYLFLNSIQVETDTLLTVNTIIKGLLFIWLFRMAFGKITKLAI